MTELSALYQQLEQFAHDNHISVEQSISQLIELNKSGINEHYFESLELTTTLMLDVYDSDNAVKRWFEYIKRVKSYDIGMLFIFENDLITLRFANDSLKVSDSIDVNQQWEVSAFPHIAQVQHTVEGKLLLGKECDELTTVLGLTRMNVATIIPIASKHGTLGVVTLFADQDRDYSTANQLLIPFVNILSGILQTSRLIATIYQNTDELASLYHATSVLFQADNLRDFAFQITEVVTRTFDYADCGLMIVDDEEGNIIRVARAGTETAEPNYDLHINGMGLVPKAVREQRIIYEPDVKQSIDYVAGDERSQCELVVPLKSNKRILGVLDFQSKATHAFSERDQRIIVAFAERVAPALENVVLYDELRRHTIELEQRVAQRTLELQNTKEQLETIIKNSPDAIVLLNSDGHIQQANLAWLSMVGCSMRDVLDTPMIEYLHGEHQISFQFAFEKTLKDELENDITVQISPRTTNIAIDIEISLAPVVDKSRQDIVCNIRDMTKHKETERLLRDALIKSQELSELKMNFVTMASHEFRTPLTTIMSSSDIVSQYYERLSQQKILRHMTKIQQEVDYLNSLIDDILLIGSSGDEGFTAKYESTDLLKLINDSISRVRTRDQEKHPIHVKIEEHCRTTIMDSRLLSYILENLLTNACKYSEAGSPILLDISLNDTLQIKVQDHGIGIPEKDVELLFDSFYRGSNVGNVRGTGIGLAIVNEALSALSGKIEVKSKVNYGTTIIIYLPIPIDSLPD